MRKKIIIRTTTIVLVAVLLCAMFHLQGAESNLKPSASELLQCANQVSFASDFSEEKDDSYACLYDRIIAEDGFIYGMDYNWFGTWGEACGVLGDNQITGYPSPYREAYVKRCLYNIKAFGFNAVNVWITADGGAYTYDENGLVTGLNDTFKKNFESLLNSFREVCIAFVPTLCVHGYASTYNQSSNGLSPQEKYFKYFRYYYDDEARKAYIDNGINPICELMSEYQDVIAMVNLTVENGTFAINDPDNGMIWATYYGTTWEKFAKLVNSLNDASKRYMPNVPTTVEDVAWEENSYKYNDLKVDIVGFNAYASGTAPKIKNRLMTKPAYVGEYNLSEVMNSQPVSETEWSSLIVQNLKQQIEGGYKGSFYFHWLNGDDTTYSFFKSTSADDYESLRLHASAMAYTINDYKYKHKNYSGMDIPALLYNNGSDTNYWIGGRNVDRFILERTSDGGKTWTVISDSINSDNNMLDNGIMYYKDTTMTAGITYQYRVTAVGEDGRTAASAYGNETQLNKSTELFVNSDGEYAGGFEAGMLNGDSSADNSNGWYDGAWGAPIGEFTTEEARSGNYSLKCDIPNGIGTNEDYSAKWVYNLKLEPDSKYELSYWYKNSTGGVSVTVRPGNNDSNLCWVSNGHTEDEEWHKASVIFTAPSDGKIRVVLMSVANDSTKFYYDDFSIIKTQ